METVAQSSCVSPRLDSPAVTSAPWKVPPQPDPLAAIKERVLAELNAQSDTLYALLDAARNELVLKLLQEMAVPAGLPDDPRQPPPPDNPERCEYQSLYLGKMAVEMAEQGPYLVRLPKGCPLLTAVVGKGWGDAWGVFLTSSATLVEVRRHFRHFIMVRHPDGDAMFFRFYDPRVLKPFLTVSTAQEASQFLGQHVTALVIETKGGNEWMRFTLGQSGLFHRCR